MSRITALSIAALAAALVAAPAARADGIDLVGYGDDCWSDASDADQDGLDDGCEQALAYWFMPMLWFDSGESGYGRLPHFAVKNVGFAARTVQVFYMNAYFDDTGVVTGHDGDAEFQIAEVHYSGGRWYLDWMYMSAHRKSVCDSSAWYSYDQLEYDTSVDPRNDFRGWPTIYAAEDKHATYNNLETCDAGCYYQDYCSRHAYQHLDQTDWLSGRNVGSTAAPLIDRVDRNGKSEHLLQDGDFTGWDNQWYRPNSGGYRPHLDELGF